MTDAKVTGAPERVWLCYGAEVDTAHGACAEVTWSESSTGPADVEYVRADILAELARRHEATCELVEGERKARLELARQVHRLTTLNEAFERELSQVVRSRLKAEVRLRHEPESDG